MGQRYDVCTPRPDSRDAEKTWWHKVGSAWKSDKGLITIYLDSVPVPDKESGKIKMMLFEPREKESGESAKTNAKATATKKSRDEDDEIPF